MVTSRTTSKTTAKPAASTTKKSTTTSKSTAAKPAAAKSTVKKSSASPAKKPSSASAAKTGNTTGAGTVKRAPSRKPAAPAKGVITPEQRYRMTQEAAYYLAEKSGFAGEASDYWARAEAQINIQLAGK